MRKDSQKSGRVDPCPNKHGDGPAVGRLAWEAGLGGWLLAATDAEVPADLHVGDSAPVLAPS